MRRRPRLPLEALAPYLLNVADPPAPLDWRTVFGNHHPVEVEIGFGKGLFLLTAAQASPACNFLGIELVRKYQLFTATRIAKRHLSNVRLACADARLFLRDWMATDSLQAVHVYFPDPWWKKRHHKRRLFTPAFAAQCERVLGPGGRLHFATDVEAYFKFVAELIPAATRLQPMPLPAPRDPVHDLDYLTNFERKFRQQGKAIYRTCYEKIVSPS